MKSLKHEIWSVNLNSRLVCLSYESRMLSVISIDKLLVNKLELNKWLLTYIVVHAQMVMGYIKMLLFILLWMKELSVLFWLPALVTVSMASAPPARCKKNHSWAGRFVKTLHSKTLPQFHLIHSHFFHSLQNQRIDDDCGGEANDQPNPVGILQVLTN